MKPKAYLSQLRTIDHEVDILLERVERDRARLTRITPQYGEHTSGGKQDWTDAVARLMELEAKLNARIDVLVDTRTEIEAAIAEVPDATERMLLELRYVDGLRWDEIARRMDYDVRQVYRLHGRALLHIRVRE